MLLMIVSVDARLNLLFLLIFCELVRLEFYPERRCLLFYRI